MNLQLGILFDSINYVSFNWIVWKKIKVNNFLNLPPSPAPSSGYDRQITIIIAYFVTVYMHCSKNLANQLLIISRNQFLFGLIVEADIILIYDMLMSCSFQWMWFGNQITFIAFGKSNQIKTQNELNLIWLLKIIFLKMKSNQ